MVLSGSIPQQRIRPGTIWTLHVFKLNDRYVSAGRGLEGRGVMDGSGLRAGELRRESAKQQERRPCGADWGMRLNVG